MSAISESRKEKMDEYVEIDGEEYKNAPRESSSPKLSGLFQYMLSSVSSIMSPVVTSAPPREIKGRFSGFKQEEGPEIVVRFFRQDEAPHYDSPSVRARLLADKRFEEQKNLRAELASAMMSPTKRTPEAAALKRQKDLNGYAYHMQEATDSYGFNRSMHYNRALEYAVQLGDLVKVKALLILNADPTFDNNFAIHKAAQEGYLDVLRFLLNIKGVDPSANHNAPIIVACLNGHNEIVAHLLADARVDPSDQNNSAIQFACQYGHIDIVCQLLADPRVDPSDNDNLAIRLAREAAEFEIVNLLSRNSRVTSKPSYTLL